MLPIARAFNINFSFSWAIERDTVESKKLPFG